MISRETNSEINKSSPRYYQELVRKLASVLSLVLMGIILSFLSPYFFTVENIFAIGLQMAVIAIMAIGQMMVIIAAGIDLSVGSVLALSGRAAIASSRSMRRSVF